MTSPAIEIRGVTKRFTAGRHRVTALDNVTLDIESGSCHAIVGESGSGKTTLGSIILGLYPPSGGEIVFNGNTLPARRPLTLRRALQLVQQNPLSALNPKRSIGASLRLPLDVHDIGSANGRKQRVGELLEEVGLEPAMAHRAPAALSGGQRQRVAIARALACDPKVIVLDEPTSALDVLVQARVLELLAKLQVRHGLTYIFITHDLAVVRNIADRVSVFRGGRIVENGTPAQLFSAPRTDYARQLISAIPVVSDEDAQLRERISATVAEPNEVFAGFHRRSRKSAGVKLFQS